MNPTETTSKSTETLPTATDPSTAVTLEEAKEEECDECPGCLRSKAEEDYMEVRCARCTTEMCGQCYSVSPVEGDDECYCKRCAQVVLDEHARKEEEWDEEEEGGCVYCHDEEIYAHCDECEVLATGDGGAMCRACFYEHGHEEYEPHQRWCGGCWRERCEKRGEEE